MKSKILFIYYDVIRMCCPTVKQRMASTNKSIVNQQDILEFVNQVIAD